MPPSASRWMLRSRTDVLIAAVLLLAPAGTRAQHPAVRDVLPGWIGLVAAPGREMQATEAIMAADPGWTRGPLGSLVRRAGAGSPRRVIACALDRPAYAISEIASDGYLRVHNAEPTGRHPLWDQFHEGQRVLVQTRAGRMVPGVFAVRSTHLWRRRAQLEALATADDLWLDVGATNAAEVRALDIRMLDPVVRELPGWTYGDPEDPYFAGPGAIARIGCAAVAAIGHLAPTTGENVYVIATQSSFDHSGLAAVLATLGRVDEIVDVGMQPRQNTQTVVRGLLRAPLPNAPGRDRRTSLNVRARQVGTLMESVRAGDAAELVRTLSGLAGVTGTPRFVSLPAPPAAREVATIRDRHSDVGNLLGRMTDLYGVSGHEEAVRDAVRAALPAWARARAVIDSAGNLVVGVGPERDTAVVIAHMDEIGFDVTAIAPDGSVALRPRGGFYASLWEGQPALLHRGATRVRGVFLPRDTASRRQPAALRAWFGIDSAALVAGGARVGSAVTGYKRAARLAGSRFTARSIDDRAGVTALLLAINAIDERALTHRTLFVWSVREEVGLDGAAAAGALFGANVRRVHAVDTFVSSDSPLESHRFGFAPLGAGAVLRALDNSSVTPPAEIERVEALAKRRGIPLQIGTTNGGNDGSELVRYGAVNIPISWPLRYSHSPAEVVDLRDIRAMADMVRALVEAR